jgi:diaminohydroxyphosphoribosylaminopyrimidine deaminase/5-amino-6-(5-phosphoribosylamino)uracil reductase
LIAAGVVQVVAAMVDPNAKVAGNGHSALEDAGISVRTGLLQEEAAAQNAGFLSRMQRGRPLLRLKIAASLDGRTAMTSGKSQWITGEAARNDVQRLRAASGAVMVGIGTVLADDPSLNVRSDDIDHGGMQPLRVVLDSNLQMPASARMLDLPGATIVFCTHDRNRKALEAAGASVQLVAGQDKATDLAAVMGKLADLEINDVLVEAGPTLAGSMLASGLVDELVIYQAPHIMGSESRGMFVTPGWQHRWLLRNRKVRRPHRNRQSGNRVLETINWSANRDCRSQSTTAYRTGLYLRVNHVRRLSLQRIERH